MLVLFETAAGYAVFKLLDEKKLSQVDNLYQDFESADKAREVVKLQTFKKFEDTTEALAAATASIEGKMSKSLKKLLKKVASNELQEELAVADAKVGNLIQEKFDISCVTSTAVNELMRGIRQQMDSLITGLTAKETTAMSLGLAHSLSRYKLKFSPDKVDTMIVQAISLLDDLDKELNNYAMRCREWYGWHFPEIGKIVTDNLAYAKTIQAIGKKDKAADTDLSSILPEEIEAEVKAAAEISMGTDMADEDVSNVNYLCDQIIQISEYRMTLYDYLRNRMQAIAPNLTVLVGELVGARLISHAGSLLNLAKHPASTVQILGAEKALFRALKTKHDTPKYGLIYHASMVGQASAKTKGKISRMLAAKSSLAARYDVLGDDVTTEMGIQNRAKIEAKIRFLEEGGMSRISGSAKSASKQQKFEVKREDIPVYNSSMDTTIGKKRKKMEEEDEEKVEDVKKVKVEKEEEVEEEAPKKKKKKKSISAADDTLKEEESMEVVEEDKPKKKKKKKSEVETTEEEAAAETVEVSEEAEEKPKKKKKKKSETDSTPEVATEVVEAPEVTEETSTEKPKKKKKKKSEAETTEEEATPVETAELSEEVTEKPKKKKKKSEAEETPVETAEVEEEPVVEKKKKKKKSKSEEQS